VSLGNLKVPRYTAETYVCTKGRTYAQKRSEKTLSFRISPNWPSDRGKSEHRFYNNIVDKSLSSSHNPEKATKTNPEDEIKILSELHIVSYKYLILKKNIKHEKKQKWGACPHRKFTDTIPKKAQALYLLNKDFI
jgi:hypothetical protein